MVAGLALPSHGVHSTVLIGALLGIVALALALGERLLPAAARTDLAAVE